MIRVVLTLKPKLKFVGDGMNTDCYFKLTLYFVASAVKFKDDLSFLLLIYNQKSFHYRNAKGVHSDSFTVLFYHSTSLKEIDSNILANNQNVHPTYILKRIHYGFFVHCD